MISNDSNFVGFGDCEFVEKAMSVDKDCSIKACNYWKPIKSTVTNTEIEDLEKKIGFEYPTSYVDFLKYKHFYTLRFYGCEFIPHPINSWKKNIDFWNNTRPRNIYRQRFIVFAYHLLEGAYCFDANNDSSIELWTPENPKIETDFKSNSFTQVFDNFEEMMDKLNNDNLIMVDNNAS